MVKIIQGDITELTVDAIVNAANSSPESSYVFIISNQKLIWGSSGILYNLLKLSGNFQREISFSALHTLHAGNISDYDCAFWKNHDMSSGAFNQFLTFAICTHITSTSSFFHLPWIWNQNISACILASQWAESTRFTEKLNGLIPFSYWLYQNIRASVLKNE